MLHRVIIRLKKLPTLLIKVDQSPPPRTVLAKPERELTMEEGMVRQDAAIEKLEANITSRDAVIEELEATNTGLRRKFMRDIRQA
ncbi:hypothetical protein P3T76_014511 [Phytophthora citrophthora]|uniref:Uncharacterized protein n=1 Tax=Phytophthora citrophthora TaxID=4793 RepID=A0AAD9G0Y1_9STRA|nr:hypothetical protein P3T76_014511 [Phytophthora citrophthora]